MNISNTIIAGNPGGDCNTSYSSYTSNGYNIVGDATCAFSSTGDQNSTNPLLGALQINSGSTPTHALTSGSPAIDAIPTTDANYNADGSSTDQRGGARANTTYGSGTACDIGAFEYGSTHTPTALTLQAFSAFEGTRFLEGSVFLSVTFLALGGLFVWRRRKAS